MCSCWADPWILTPRSLKKWFRTVPYCLCKVAVDRFSYVWAFLDPCDLYVWWRYDQAGERPLVHRLCIPSTRGYLQEDHTSMMRVFLLHLFKPLSQVISSCSGENFATSYWSAHLLLSRSTNLANTRDVLINDGWLLYNGSRRMHKIQPVPSMLKRSTNIYYDSPNL